MKSVHFSIATNTSKQLKYIKFPTIHKNNPPFFLVSNQIALEIFDNVISLSELEGFFGSFSLFSVYHATVNLGRKTVHDK